MLFSTNMSTNTNKNHPLTIVPLEPGDGSSIEVVKRPRGRPPGSKNKPKPPVIITRDAPEPTAAMRPHILEIPSGHDVIESLVNFSRCKNLGICVLAGNGAVSNLTLRQPPHPAATGESAATTVGFRGRFEILSLSATVMPPAAAGAAGAAGAGTAVSVAGPQGQVIGGTVVGPLIAVGTVTVVAAAFENLTFHKLPVAVVVEENEMKCARDEKEEENEPHQEQNPYAQQQQQQREYHNQQRQQQQQSVESCGIGIYGGGSHFPAEVIWARQQHPPPY